MSASEYKGRIKDSKSVGQAPDKRLLLEDLQRYCLVDEETGDIEYGDFISIYGAILRIFGRKPMHTHPAEDHPLEEEEVDALCPGVWVPGYVIGRVEWNQSVASAVAF